MDRKNVNGQINPAAQVSPAETEQVKGMVAEVKELAEAMNKADRNGLKRSRRLGECLNDLKRAFEAGRLAYRGRILKRGEWKAFVQSLGVSEWRAKDARRIFSHWDEVKECASIREAMRVLEGEDEEESPEVGGEEQEVEAGGASRYEEPAEVDDGEEEEEEVIEESRPKSANSSLGGRQKQPEQASKASKSRAKPEKSTSKGGGKGSGKLSLVDVFRELQSRPRKEQLRVVQELYDEDGLLLWLHELWAICKKKAGRAAEDG